MQIAKINSLLENLLLNRLDEEVIALDYYNALEQLELVIEKARERRKDAAARLLNKHGEKTKSGGKRLILNGVEISQTKPIGAKYLEPGADKRWVKLVEKPNLEAINEYLKANGTLPEGVGESVREGNISIKKYVEKEKRKKITSPLKESPLAGVQFKKVKRS